MIYLIISLLFIMTKNDLQNLVTILFARRHCVEKRRRAAELYKNSSVSFSFSSFLCSTPDGPPKEICLRARASAFTSHLPIQSQVTCSIKGPSI